MKAKDFTTVKDLITTSTKKPNHFAVENIMFYAMDEDNEIITNEKGEAVMYQIKDGVRFKPLEYLCEDMDQEIMEEVKNG
jgi:hypothetical protein